MQSEKEKVALTSIAISAGLTVAKAVVGFLSGSLALLSEAAHSAIDCLATIMTYFAVRISGKPADAEHHYGHGKVESVTALAETALLFGLSGVVIWEAASRLFSGHGHAVEATLWAFGVIVVSIVVDFFRARLLYRVAHETASEALEADALHFGSDMWSSIAVLIGLCGLVAGFPWADSAAALVVAVFVCVAGWRLGRRTIDTLTDAAPAGSADAVSNATARVRGVVAVEQVRVRPVGDKRFVELVVAVSRTLPLDRVELLKREVADAVRAALPRAEVSVATASRALDNELVIERVMVIARNQALAVHHVTVHDIRGKLSVSLDLEVDRKLPLAARTTSPTGWKRRCARNSAPTWRSKPTSSRCRPTPRGAKRSPSASGRCSRRWPRSPPRAAWLATFTMCGCARPTKARSSISIAGSTRR